MMGQLRYSMYIRWSDEDQCYIAWLPEFGDSCMSHGATYEEAAKNGQEALESLVHGESDLPMPFVYGSGHAIVPPSYEAQPLSPDWYDKTLERLDDADSGTNSRAERAIG